MTEPKPRAILGTKKEKDGSFSVVVEVKKELFGDVIATHARGGFSTRRQAKDEKNRLYRIRERDPQGFCEKLLNVF